MRYYTIKEKLYLVEQEIPGTDAPVVPDPVNHIWIYDRSYSMSYDLPALAKDLIYKAKDIPKGDTLSLGWFSSEGEFNFILKGFRVIDGVDYKILENAINKNRTPVGCTCFSEILADTENVIEDLSVISDKFSLMFFTDGYPVVRNYSREIESIYSAVEKLEGKVTSSCMIGYGNYYNRDLMMEMAERLGGSLIHSNDLPQFSIALDDLIKNAGSTTGKTPVEFTGAQPTENIVFSLNVDHQNSATINMYRQKEDGTVMYPQVMGTDKEYLYFLTDKIKGDETEVTLTEDEFKRPTNKESMIRALYALSCILNQKTKTSEALEVIGSLGDTYLVDTLNNAFTNAEHGEAEEALRKAIHTPKSRILAAYDTSYLPPADTFCLLDVIEMLLKDEDACFYPYHEDFKYKKISRGTKTKGEFPKFVAEKNPKCDLSTLAWHKTKLNLSVKARIQGTIDLGDEAEKLGFAKNYPTYVFRNYAIVKDGFLNTPWLPVTLSKNTYEILSEKGVIWHNGDWEKDRIYVLELNKVPVMNRAIAEGKTSATDLSKKVFEEIKLQAQIKVLNDAKKSLEEKTDYVDSTFAGLSEDQINFLKEKGIGKNGFSPDVEKEDPVDFYYAKDFAIKVKSFSSLPSINDTKKRIASGKLRPADEVMKLGIDLYDNSPVADQSDKIKLAWVEEKVKELKNQLLDVRFDIQRTKFAIILGKKWFDEFDSRNDSTLEVDGKTFTIAVEEKQVTI